MERAGATETWLDFDSLVTEPPLNWEDSLNRAGVEYATTWKTLIDITWQKRHAVLGPNDKNLYVIYWDKD